MNWHRQLGAHLTKASVGTCQSVGSQLWRPPLAWLTAPDQGHHSLPRFISCTPPCQHLLRASQQRTHKHMNANTHILAKSHSPWLCQKVVTWSCVWGKASPWQLRLTLTSAPFFSYYLSSLFFFQDIFTPSLLPSPPPHPLPLVLWGPWLIHVHTLGFGTASPSFHWFNLAGLQGWTGHTSIWDLLDVQSLPETSMFLFNLNQTSTLPPLLYLFLKHFFGKTVFIVMAYKGLKIKRTLISSLKWCWCPK